MMPTQGAEQIIFQMTFLLDVENLRWDLDESIEFCLFGEK